jgi:diaminopimelate decarboxylase
MTTLTQTSTTTSTLWPRDSGANAHGHFEIGGCDAVDLVREFGSPAYIVSEDELRRRAQEYMDAFAAAGHSNFDVLFASKAFPSLAVYRVLVEHGLSCDAASAGELFLALRGGMDPARICLHGNAKTDDELRYAMQCGVGYVVVDSFDEIERLSRLVQGMQDVLVRVTPGIRPTTHVSISTGQSDSKFGFGMVDAPDAIAQIESTGNLNLRGLHVHIGSQIMDLEPFAHAVEAIAPLGDFEVYNLGGGLGVAYLSDDRPKSIGEYVKQKVQAVHTHLGRDKRILIEPGRSIVANAGVTLYSVVSVKHNVSTYVAVDGGMSDNLRPMLYSSPYEAALANRFDAHANVACRLVGKHCESGDVIVPDACLNDPAVGDVVVTPVTGAYGHAMANNYNAMLRPPVIFCKDGHAQVVVRRESFEDLAARDVF